MTFDIYGFIMNPFVLLFLTVAIGLGLGEIKIRKISLGSSGALFVGLLFGWIISRIGESVLDKGQDASGYEAAAKMLDNGVINSILFTAALVVFVAAVGLLAGKDIGIVIKKYGITFIIIGIIITFIGAGTTYMASTFIKDSNPYEVVGIYTGALTSSPGLAAALETAEKHALEEMEKQNTLFDVKNKFDEYSMEFSCITLEEPGNKLLTMKETFVQRAVAGVGVGHAIGYPFGLIVVILAINFLPIMFRINIDEEKRKYSLEMNSRGRGSKSEEAPEGKGFSVLAFSLTCILGFALGTLTIRMGFLGDFTLGVTGGVLIAALILGFFGKVGPVSFRMDPKILAVVRELGLAFFLAIVGLKYGFMTVETLLGSGATLALVSLGVTFISLMSGFLLGRYVFKLNWIMLSGALCGGMTSTPGLGVCIDTLKSDDPAAGYGATYPFALFGMIVFTIIIHSL